MTTPWIRRIGVSRGMARSRERTETLVVDGRTFTYQDVGAGPTVILAHGDGASHREWAPVVAALRNRYRVLTPQLLGYGRSEPSPLNQPFHPWSDLGALLALANSASEAAHLVGHSYGGALALEAARALTARVESLTLIDPVAFHLMRLHMSAHPERTADGYRGITTPTRLIAGQQSPSPARAIAEELKHILGNAHLRVLAGAGHMSPITHPVEIAALAAEHIDDNRRSSTDDYRRNLTRASMG
jgi:pimeloyl-ACP methyl ester carboxylesterase